MNKEQIKTAADKAVEFTGKQNWPVWVKHLVAAIIGAAAAVTTMTMTSCTDITPEQVQDAHALYHVVSGKPCIFILDDVK